MKNENKTSKTSKNLSDLEQFSNQNRDLEISKDHALVIHDYSNTKRKTPRVIQDFSQTVSRTEQHTASTNDLNVLVERYTPDELTNYLIAKGRQRPPITGHDFSIEPSYQDALNEVQRIKNIFNGLPHEVQSQFKSPLEFVRFVDNPQNVQRLVDMKLLSPQDITKQPTTTTNQTTTTTTTTSETPNSAT